eukprot:GHVR01173746.1.p1 GENE.GHVR01173746.1~~GHVR01173746.1.p1  ORF type:complete len:120 (+),score=29.52 GHVR01173746.1:72-431(+)
MPKHFNVEKGSNLMGGGSEGHMMYKMMLDKFTEELHNKAKAIHNAGVNENVKELRSAAHALKGSSTYVAADTIHELCQEIQLICDKHDGPGWKENLKKLISEFDRVVSEAKVELKSLSS